MRSLTLAASLLLATLIASATEVAAAAAAADLPTDLRELITLVPRRRIALIAARHFVIDPHFREALDYIRGEQFTEAWQEIRGTPEFGEIVDYIVRATASGYDVTGIVDSIPNQLRAIRLPANVRLEVADQRNLSTFLRELVRSLPRARITNFVARKVKERGEFAMLYAALRKPEFRAMVDKARSSTNLAGPIQQFVQHSIDVDELIELTFAVLKWGP